MQLTRLLPSLAACLAVALFAEPAAAQFDNRPYQFKNSGGIGMSTAGRQAIIEQEVLGRTPDNLVRRNGVLLGVVEGPGGEALARDPGSSFLPSARPSGFRITPASRVGAFNAFFMSSGGGSGAPAAFQSSTALTGWTRAVATESYGSSFARNTTSSVIAAWTEQVYRLR